MPEKIKGIRLKDEELDWWENEDNAPDKIRAFIKKDIERKKNGFNEIKDKLESFDPKTINKLNEIINLLSNDKSNKIDNNDRDSEKMDKVNKLINSMD